MFKLFFLAMLCLLATPSFSSTIQLDYDNFTIWHDCKNKGPSFFYFYLDKDDVALDLDPSIGYEPSLPRSCQPFSLQSYSQINREYVGVQLIAPRHFDNDAASLSQTYYVSNFIPLLEKVDKTLIHRINLIIECFRDRSAIEIIGGVKWGANGDDEHFLLSHGQRTPEAIWYAIFSGDQILAWLIPNTNIASTNLDDYIVSPKQIENAIGLTLPTKLSMERMIEDHSWKLPSNCNFD